MQYKGLNMALHLIPSTLPEWLFEGVTERPRDNDIALLYQKQTLLVEARRLIARWGRAESPNIGLYFRSWEDPLNGILSTGVT